jgi:DNA-binding FadR family transcriptional regulator
LLRTSFEISTARPRGAAHSLPLHRAVLDAVIERKARKAEQAVMVLIDGAARDIEIVLSGQGSLPSLAAPASPLRAPLNVTESAG